MVDAVIGFGKVGRFYKIVLAYVIFFRECLNEIGWNKKIESDNIDLEK